MSPKDRERLRTLTERLDRLERDPPTPETAPIWSIGRAALIDEIARLARGEWLIVRRRGDGLEAVSLSG